MAFAVERGDRWELRESVATDNGPRSRTLASFRELTPEVIESALERATAPLDVEDVYAAARRSGAPVGLDPASAAAGELLAALGSGRELPETLRRVLLDALEGDRAPEQHRASDAERSATQWLGASARRRGEALRELLMLADRIPASLRPRATSFPRIDTAQGHG